MERTEREQLDGGRPDKDPVAEDGPGKDRAAGARARTPLPSFAYTDADAEKMRGVRRMKTTATGALLLVALIFVLATWAKNAGAGPWAGYVAAAAEAGMVGALADWFAVTALFRYPLGLPIPHTAIIPNKKDQLGTTLGSFVGENFLSGDVVRTRLHALGIGRRLGAWLAEPAHADRVTAELSTALRGALAVLRDSDVQAVVGEAITRRADSAEIAPGVGKTLEKVVADGAHHRAVDLICARAHDWLVLHADSVLDAVEGGAPGWTPRFVDKRVGERVYKELLRFVTEMRDMPEHPARGAIDRFLTDFAADLQSDTDTRDRVERMKSELLSRSEVQDVIASAWSSVRAMIISAAEDDRSELRLRARASLLSLGARLATDGRLQSKLEGWVEEAAVYVVTTYRAEITSLISDTVASWDAEHTSRKIEAHIGRDLQFIRINGTVVGALAGLLIYTLAHALGA
ncbi:DUF445 domain-containing protein [Streptomyces lunaelactis]|uniref:DUF445 domain-containing protein n=1 Tax=Streptomyces lunaelactis TaxID=1535768 RepID=UPI001584BCE1|nr:DUF445 domain-containing protein [Streptomyces lunaelactis]NUK03881.1 DUF445 domain-containing protein [Streptomyces lunaelactis]NUK19525.1 DUF445 domain-containing protein [Streptomyces lunaelactis]